MERKPLNNIEQAVYDLCLENEKRYGEEGGFCYDEINYTKLLGLTTAQMKGYLSQLCQKGYIFAEEDSYFTHYITDIYNQYNK